jgi:parallel beta-helix repeat protein
MSPPLILATVCTILFSLINPISAYPHGKTIHVSSGQSIQAAIDSAHGGDKIVVDAGTYAEQLTISTNGITLVGDNAIIVPPSVAVTNTCSNLAGNGTEAVQAGICVTGSNVVLQDLADFDGEHRKVISVGQRVKDTYIKGFTVNGFSGLNIAVVGAQDAIVTENSVSSGAQYGILTVGSKNSKIKHNTVLSVEGPYPFYFIGICMDDVSTVTIAHNDISGYFIGLCVQTDGADIHDNKVHDICVGAFVDPGIKGAKLHDNDFSSIIPGCPSTPNPQFSSGITISGGMNTVVKSNKFSGIKNGGQAAGVVIIDDPTTGVVSSGNDVEKNVFTDNDLDVFEQTTGKGNVVKKNQCTLSNPVALCQ